MKILVVSEFSDDPKVYTYASSFVSTLRSLGNNTGSFSVSSLNYGKLGFIKNYLSNRKLLSKVDDYKPELVFFVKANIVTPSTISKIKQSGARVVNFYTDNPFVFWNGNSNSNVLNSLPLYDEFLTWSQMLIPAIKSAGCVNVSYFPFAYDETLIKPVLADKVYDVCFVGTWEASREAWLSKLALKMPHLKIAIWGNMWDTQLDEASILRKFYLGEAIYKDEMILAFNQSKIVLNFIRPQNETAHNMRTFEVPASGAFLLTQRTDEQVNIFREDFSIECFSDLDELCDKIEFYLENDLEREAIVENAKEVIKNYRLKIWLKNLLNKVDSNAKAQDRDLDIASP